MTNTSLLGVNTALSSKQDTIDTSTALDVESLSATGNVSSGSITLPTGAGSGLVLTSDASGNGSWQPSSGGGGAGAVSAGMVGHFATTSSFVDPGWMVGDGRMLSKSVFPALFTALGTTFGGDGVTTFALPEYRSTFLRAYDAARWVNFTRTNGTTVTEVGPSSGAIFQDVTVVMCVASGLSLTTQWSLATIIASNATTLTITGTGFSAEQDAVVDYLTKGTSAITSSTLQTLTTPIPVLAGPRTLVLVDVSAARACATLSWTQPYFGTFYNQPVVNTGGTGYNKTTGGCTNVAFGSTGTSFITMPSTVPRSNLISIYNGLGTGGWQPQLVVPVATDGYGNYGYPATGETVRCMTASADLTRVAISYRGFMGIQSGNAVMADTAYVFRKLAGETAWTNEGQLSPTTAPASGGTYIINSMSMSAGGTRCIVNNLSLSSGTPVIYVRNTTTNVWTIEQTLSLTSQTCVSMFRDNDTPSNDGTMVIVGCKTTGAGSTAGSAQVWTRGTGTVWSQLGATITASDAAAGDAFGTSVSIMQGTDNVVRVAIGAPGKPAVPSNLGSGSVYTYKYVAGWVNDSKLVQTGVGASLLGNSVCLANDNTPTGEIVLVGGAPGISGAAYFWKCASGVWASNGVFVGTTAGAGFGTALALSEDGTQALISAPAEAVPTAPGPVPSNGSSTGVTYLYSRNSLGVWAPNNT